VQTLFFLSLSKNPAVYEIMWKNSVERGRPHMTIWHMGIESWIRRATYTHSDYVMLIAFLPQQLLHERASVLRYIRTLPVLLRILFVIAVTLC